MVNLPQSSEKRGGVGWVGSSAVHIAAVKLQVNCNSEKILRPVFSNGATKMRKQKICNDTTTKERIWTTYSKHFYLHCICEC